MPRPTIKKDIVGRNAIRSRLDPWAATMVTISSADVTADGDGKKILPAGTFLGSVDAIVDEEDGTVTGNSILRNGSAAKPANDASTEGLLLNEVDVTYGDVEASMLYMGTIGLDRIPEAPDAAVNLPRVTFTAD